MADNAPIPASVGLRLFQLANNRRVLSNFTFKLVLSLSLVNVTLWITAVTLQIVLLSSMERSSLYILVCLATCWSILILIATAVSSCGLLANHPKDVKGFGIVAVISSILSLLIFVFHVVALSLDSFEWAEEASNWTIPGSFTVFTSLFAAGGNAIALRQMIYEWRHFCKEVDDERAEKIQQYLKAEQQIYINQLQAPVALEELERKERAEMDGRLERLELMEQMERHQSESNYVVTAVQFLRAAENEQDIEEQFSFYPPVFV